MAPEAHRMIAAMDGSSVDFQFTMQEFSMVCGYTEDLKKKHKTVKIGRWALTPGRVLVRDNVIRSILHLQYEIRILQVLNHFGKLATRLQVSFLAR